MWLSVFGIAVLAAFGSAQIDNNALRPQGPIAAPIARPVNTFNTRPIASSVSRPFSRPSFNRVGSSGSEDPCRPSPCGPNTRCDISRTGIALCRCLADFVPDGHTINGCKPQCTHDDECPDDYRCSNTKCVRVCQPGACGINANCDTRNHRARCTCPAGYRGDAHSGGCQRILPAVRDNPPAPPINPCVPNPCGSNADCTVRADRAVCSCPFGYEGDPLTNCIKGECTAHEDCPNHMACRDLRCFDPCVGVCGTSTECIVRNHQPVCSCPRNFVGNPFVSCRRFDPRELCEPSPCGQNTNCDVRTDASGSSRAVCSCFDNYMGNPLTGCTPECVVNSDCGPTRHCRENRCRNPCLGACGTDAYCDVRNHVAVCSCPQYYQGDPHSRCYAECTAHEECRDHQACFQLRCINPCEGACGTGADCKVENHKPICSCPRGYTGDPFVSCRAFTREDLCRDNPCGTNGICTPGYDREGNDRPVCTCPTGYIGNPLVSCQRGECETHNQCPDHEACYAYMCESPCVTETGSVCGDNADCRVRNHQPVCSCPRGYVGNPLTGCQISASAGISQRFFAGASKKK